MARTRVIALDRQVELIMKKTKTDPMALYSPSAKQKEFHESLSHKDLFLAGNGSGKTFVGTHEFAMAVSGRHWVDGKYPKPPIDARICSYKESLTGGENAIIPLLKRLLKNDLVDKYPLKSGKEYESKWLLKNGSMFDILTYDQDDDKFESVSKDLIWFDEPFRESIWKASVARMRKGKGGKILMTMTPLLHAAWMYDKFIKADIDKDKANVIVASIWDNCKCLSSDLHDDNPDYPLDQYGHCRCNGGYLHKEAIDLMVAEYDEEEIDARVKGLFVTMRDIVFTQFEPNAHVLPEDLTPQEVKERGMQLYVSIDPHQRRPPAWGLFGVDPDGIIYILDEFPNTTKGIYGNKRGVATLFYEQIKSCNLDYSQLTREFYEYEQYWGGGVIKRFMDPRHAHSKLPNTNEMIIQAYRNSAYEQGIDMKFVPAYVGSDSTVGEIASGITLVRQKLAYSKDLVICASNMPGLFINPSCKNTIRMFNYFKYVTKSGRVSEGKAPTETFEEKYKDFADVVRYFVKSVKRYKKKDRVSGYNYAPINSRTGF